LAWAQVVWATLEVIALFVIMGMRLPKLFDLEFGATVLKMMLATLAMSVVTYCMVLIMDLQFVDQNILMVVPQLLVIGVVSATAYMVVSRLLKIQEVNPIIERVKKIIFPKLKTKTE
jgi:peptidoglycan biosynthesis protein MviN/MurJ (putative lipid II flippase)